MRKLTRESNPFEIRDRIVKAYLKMILRRFKRLNQGTILGFDEINALSAVNATYEDVINLTVEALQKVAKQTYRWICDEDFPADMWLSGFLQEFDPVTHYKFFDEADRKRSRAYEAIMSTQITYTQDGTEKAVASSEKAVVSSKKASERKKQIEIATKYWVRQFEQTADNVVDAIIVKAYKDNNVKYVRWYTMKDAKVCADCKARDGKMRREASLRWANCLSARMLDLRVSYSATQKLQGVARYNKLC